MLYGYDNGVANESRRLEAGDRRLAGS